MTQIVYNTKLRSGSMELRDEQSKAIKQPL